MTLSAKSPGAAVPGLSALACFGIFLDTPTLHRLT